jgi:hypothetical protein
MKTAHEQTPRQRIEQVRDEFAEWGRTDWGPDGVDARIGAGILTDALALPDTHPHQSAAERITHAEQVQVQGAALADALTKLEQAEADSVEVLDVSGQ